MGRLAHLEGALEQLARADLLRTPRSHAELPAEAIWLCSNDYLGLAQRPTEALGPGGAGASSLVWGHGPEHERAERAFADYAGVEACLLFSSGYAANVGALAALAGPGDLVVSDALNHASIVDGCRLSGARIATYPHLDLDAAGAALDRYAARRRFLVTESYFSMDADGPDLAAAADLAARTGAVLVVDEAHALGVLGPGGRGRCAEAGVTPDVLIGTLGKAFGLSGAFVGGSKVLRTWLWNRARSFVFSTAMPPALAHAAARRVPEVRAAEGERATLHALGETFRGLLADELGARPPGFGPIVPIHLGDPRHALEMTDLLRAEGWIVQPMRPPTVPRGTSRLRLTVRATQETTLLQRAALAIGRAHAAVTTAPSRGRGSGAGLQPTTGAQVRPRRVAVVGTGTEVGKTYVTRRLVEHLASLGVRVSGRKPVESGVVGDVGDDQRQLDEVSSAPAPGPAPFRFTAAVSPHLAARLEGRAIDLAAAASWASAGEAEVIVVESAGGLLSPLADGATNLDLVTALEPDAVVVVAADRLGVLHDVAAVKLALGARGLWSRAVVCLSTPERADTSTGLNAAELVHLGLGAAGMTVWARGGSSAEATWACVRATFERST